MMFEYKKLNDLAGWTAFLISLIVYSITVEDTASFWDAGEFIAVSSKPVSYTHLTLPTKRIV